MKFPKLLSKDNVWNGITNAFWLLFQSENDWNKRRDCNADIAYIPKSEPNNNEALKKSVKSTHYSEIDFEILKESQYWPKTSYQNSNATFKTDDAANNDEIMVTCTNWDMACHEPKEFNIGAKEVVYDNNKYIYTAGIIITKLYLQKFRLNMTRFSMPLITILKSNGYLRKLFGE